jgi:type IV secretory pathway VirB2 component (pilin)
MEKTRMNDAYPHFGAWRDVPNPRLGRRLPRHHPPARVSAFCGLLCLATSPAFAQVAGGGGNTGLLSQVINWFVTNIAEGLIAAGVIFVGCLLLFGRHTLAGIAVMVIGALVIANYATLAGLFGIGG